MHAAHKLAQKLINYRLLTIWLDFFLLFALASAASFCLINQHLFIYSPPIILRSRIGNNNLL